jgi:predicted nucleic acid-binding protein
VTLGEIAFGAESAPDAGLRAALRGWLAAQIALFAGRIVPVGVDTHPHYAALRAAARRAGLVFGDNDLWIAAQALERGFAVVTRDKAFAAMPGVRALDPG